MIELKETSRFNQSDMSGWIVWVGDQPLNLGGSKIASFAATSRFKENNPITYQLSGS
ncbi:MULTISPECIES: hypothetical protein [Sphingomonas]|uniref:hypothetical protein n=1 Tax=Sphingomonas TaxID=13687 RepID=UPI002FF40C13